jgi:uncharacterized protein (TIGR03435 family)
VSVLVVGLVVALPAQASKPTFEVASVKRNVSGTPGPGGGPTERIRRQAGGLWTATNTTLANLILYAHPTPGFVTLRDDQLLGGPEWIWRDRFDIQAKAEDPDVTPQQSVAMVRTLLEERFRLVVREDHEERDVYTLMLARSDGRLGPDMHQASPECKNRRGAEAIAAIYNAPRPSNGARMSFGGQCMTLEQIAAGPMQRMVASTVIDGTGLTGLWDFVVAHSDQPRVTSDAAERPPLDVALREQLGLKLVRGKGPVKVLVIESVQPASEN